MSVWWRWVDVGLMLSLNQQWLLSLLLLAKSVDGILQLCEPCPLFVNLLSVSFGALNDCLPSHDGFPLLLEPLSFVVPSSALPPLLQLHPLLLPHLSLALAFDKALVVAKVPLG
jgi:hypothetical protein